MGLVKELKEIRVVANEPLNRLAASQERSVVIDGSLSELVGRALNVAHSKKNFTSGDPYYGAPNPDPNGDPPRGAGGVPNLFQPDSPLSNRIRPTLESQQQNMGEVTAAAAILANAINLHDKEAMMNVGPKPAIVFAIPEDKLVTKEMNEDIETYDASGAIDTRDFVFVYTDRRDEVGRNEERVFPLDQKLTEYADRGAKIYPDVQSFLNDYDNVKKKR